MPADVELLAFPHEIVSQLPDLEGHRYVIAENEESLGLAVVRCFEFDIPCDAFVFPDQPRISLGQRSMIFIFQHGLRTTVPLA